MHGYAKIKLVDSTNRSKSVDFSDLPTFPNTQKSNENITQNHIAEISENKEIENLKTKIINGDVFMKLSRNQSVSSVASQGFMLDRQGSTKEGGIHSAVKRAFSVRRSSSVSHERYSRIHHDLNDDDGNDDDNDDGVEDHGMQTRSMKMTKKRSSGGRILKACKRIFGL